MAFANAQNKQSRPIAVRKINTGLTRIHSKLKILAETVNLQIQTTASEASDWEAWDPRYEELQREEKDTVAAWTRTLSETQKQLELGKTMKSISKENSWAGPNGIEDKGLLVDSMDRGAVDSVPLISF